MHAREHLQQGGCVCAFVVGCTLSRQCNRRLTRCRSSNYAGLRFPSPDTRANQNRSARTHTHTNTNGYPMDESASKVRKSREVHLYTSKVRKIVYVPVFEFCMRVCFGRIEPKTNDHDDDATTKMDVTIMMVMLFSPLRFQCPRRCPLQETRRGGPHARSV